MVDYTSEDVFEAVESLIEMDLTIIAPAAGVISCATDIAFSANCTFYDAFYVALAIELGAHFITADKKLYSRVNNICSVSLLEDFIE